MTKQTDTWTGEFGAAYTRRNTFDAEGLRGLYLDLYGVERPEMNRRFLDGLDRDLAVLEVGCNIGNQLECLQDAGFTRLTGIELQPNAAAKARQRLPAADIHVGSAFALPWPDASFDLVFTSGVLIHIAPDDLPRAMAEIHRVSRRWIWGFEYDEESFQEIPYRGHDALMWKGPYVGLWQKTCPDLTLIRDERFPYRAQPGNRDVMYLFEKPAVSDEA